MAGQPPELPRTGRVLVTGPSNVGKTRTTAAALDRWIADRGPEGVVVLDFAPELERDGTLLGGRLTRFLDVPDGVWYGAIEARAPRAEGADPDGALALARENAERGRALLDAAPVPVALFVNDATIPFQHPDGDVGTLLDRCADAELAVLNAFESDELGVDDPVSRRESAVLERLAEWADRRVRLSAGGGD